MDDTTLIWLLLVGLVLFIGGAALLGLGGTPKDRD